MDLLTYGGLTLDFLELADGRTMLGIPGGNSLYSAIGAHIWGLSVGLAGRVGRDYPDQWLSRMADAGIDTSAVERIDTPHIQVFPARYDQSGRRTYEIPAAVYETCDCATIALLERYNEYEDNLNAIRPFMLLSDEFPQRCFAATALHCAPVPLADQLDIVPAFKHAGALVSLDPDLQSMHLLEDVHMLGNLLEHVDCFLPSREEVRAMESDTPDLTASARLFGAMGARSVVIKLGPKGVLLYEHEHDRLQHVPAYATNAVDPTGAGDAFCGGFLAGYLQTGSARTAALWGTVSASFVIEAPGALHALNVSTVDAQKRLQRLMEIAANETDYRYYRVRW